MIKEENLLTIYAVSHDVNATLVDKNNQLTTIEYDRWANTKYNRARAWFRGVSCIDTAFKPYLEYLSTLVKDPSIIKKIVLIIHRARVNEDPNILKLRSAERNLSSKKQKLYLNLTIIMRTPLAVIIKHRKNLKNVLYFHSTVLVTPYVHHVENQNVKKHLKK